MQQMVLISFLTVKNGKWDVLSFVVKMQESTKIYLGKQDQRQKIEVMTAVHVHHAKINGGKQAGLEKPISLQISLARSMAIVSNNEG